MINRTNELTRQRLNERHRLPSRSQKKHPADLGNYLYSKMASQNKFQRCCICDRPEQEVNTLLTGLKGAICDACLNNGHAQLHQHDEEEEQRIQREAAAQRYDVRRHKVLKPKEMKAFLDQYVIGQEEAKKVLSVAIYNHYKRLLNPQRKDDDVEIEKSNIIMVGETGTGKTLLAKTIAKQLQVPFAIVDATVFTEAGYVGEDVESILSRLLQAANYDIPSTERGIIFIDEIDKVGRKGDNPSITRDVSGEGVQQGMLKLLEGSEVLVPPQGGRKHPDQKMVKINTQNILFICGGAFEGIDKMIGRRVQTSGIGYNAIKKTKELDRANLLQYVNAQDLRAFGLIPELLGRLPLITYLNPLDKPALKRILTEPKNALVRQYQKLFAMDGVDLVVDDAALDAIVARAVRLKTGARGLRSVLESTMQDLMFESPDTRGGTVCHVSAATIEHGTAPLFRDRPAVA